jgi:hypothetical protein
MSTTATEQDAEQGARKHKDTVSIAYNGMNASFEYNPEHKAEATRVKALDHYGIHGPDRHQDFLFGPDNQTEVNDQATMGSQVQPGSQLYLRPRTAGGGTSR